jgi:hypothetical protein
VSDDRLAMSHEQYRIGGELALRPLEIGQPVIEGAIGQVRVHVAVHQVADECPRRSTGLEAPETIVWRLARPQNGSPRTPHQQ